MCGTTETCPTLEVGQTPPAFSLTLGLPRVYHLSGRGLHVKVRAPTTEERPCPRTPTPNPSPPPAPRLRATGRAAAPTSSGSPTAPPASPSSSTPPPSV